MTLILFLIATTLVAILTCAAIIGLKKSRPAKGAMSGVTLAIGIVFAALFDPTKAEAIENIDRRKNLGDVEEGESGEKVH